MKFSNFQEHDWGVFIDEHGDTNFVDGVEGTKFKLCPHERKHDDKKQTAE